jgi:hypothetical protein
MKYDAASRVERSKGSGSMSSRLTNLLLDPGRLAALRQTNLLDTRPRRPLIGWPARPPASWGCPSPWCR